MNFLDGSLFPENQEKLVITVAPYGPEWMPADFPEDIPVTMDEQIQKAVDCYNAGATVLHLHVRELDGKGTKRLSKFNELIAGVRARVPDMIIQVGGSISLRAGKRWRRRQVAVATTPATCWPSCKPKPDQVTIAINTNQMNIVEQMCEADLAGTSLAEPANYRAYREMTIPGRPGVGRGAHPPPDGQRHPDALPARQHHAARNRRAHDAPRHLQRAADPDLGRDRRRLRRAEHLQPRQLRARRAGRLGADARDVDAQRAAAQHDGDRDGPARALRHRGQHLDAGPQGARWARVEQIEQLVRISREVGRDVANGKEAREIYRIGMFYKAAEETLAANGFAPNRQGSRSTASCARPPEGSMDRHES